jgi:hypothetical protein
MPDRSAVRETHRHSCLFPSTSIIPGPWSQAQAVYGVGFCKGWPAVADLPPINIASVVNVINKDFVGFLTNLENDTNFAYTNPRKTGEFTFELFNVKLLWGINLLCFQTDFEDSYFLDNIFLSAAIKLLEEFISRLTELDFHG